MNNSDIYDTYKDLYLNENNMKRRYSVRELFNGTGPSKKDRYRDTVTAKENTIKKTFGKNLRYLWILTFQVSSIPLRS